MGGETLTEEEHGARGFHVGTGAGDGIVAEHPYVAAHGAGVAVEVAAVPGLVEVGGYEDEHAAAVVDAQLALQDADGLQLEGVVDVGSGGEDVGGDIGAEEHGDEGYGRVGAVAVVEDEGDIHRVDALGGRGVEVARGFRLADAVDVPCPFGILGAVVVGVELGGRWHEGLGNDPHLGRRLVDGAEGDAGGCRAAGAFLIVGI